ncbi:MAG: hypothetical protein JXK05_12100 [Campylobacterales bacterium]|nr:hypothetical protein [Campylobacterales bacterium]
MGTRISLTVNAKRYDIDIDEQFAPFLLEQMQEDFNLNGNNDLKLLLQAYIRNSYRLFEDREQIDALLKRLEEQAH